MKSRRPRNDTPHETGDARGHRVDAEEEHDAVDGARGGLRQVPRHVLAAERGRWGRWGWVGSMEAFLLTTLRKRPSAACRRAPRGLLPFSPCPTLSPPGPPSPSAPHRTRISPSPPCSRNSPKQS